MTYPVKSPKKLIEVALPLDAINTAAARVKRKAPSGYPTTLHRWFAQRPLAAARAVIFAQLVNDPSWKWELENPGQIAPNHLKASWAASRKRLFKIIEDLVLWENTTNETVLEKARAEIRKSWREVCELNKGHPQAVELFDPEKLPALHDPFAGGGSIPLEAQRLGLEAYASDLNPVAVLINKAMIEIPPKFAGRPPVSLAARGGAAGAEHNKQLELLRESATPRKQWPGTAGLAEDVRYYGAWMREEAQKRIGHLYPPVEITADMARERPDLKPLVGQRLTIVAWLWARTVKSPNPAFSHVNVPLVSSFILSTKIGKETYVVPEIDGDGYYFVIKIGTPPPNAKNGTKVTQGYFRCLLSGAPISYAYIDDEANAGRMHSKMMAIVAEGPKGRIYITPTTAMEVQIMEVESTWRPETASRGTFASNAQGRIYGFKVFGDYFTSRQLVALNTFCDLISEIKEHIYNDAICAGFSNDNIPLESDGQGATAYAEAVSVFLAFAIDRVADYGSTLATWRSKDSAMRASLSMQALPMTWDYAEGSPFGKSSSGFIESVSVIAKVIPFLCPNGLGQVTQQNAAVSGGWRGLPTVISTDPPYYDNVAYADLSDFFYVWLRRSLKSIFPSLFATLAVPKAEELIAASYRHENAEQADAFFLNGMTKTMQSLSKQSFPSYPTTIYYAFKQSETDKLGTSSSGWESFLDAVNLAGYAITGTWPVRTEGDNRRVSNGTNALASSIVLVCRARPADAPTVSRREFIRELNAVLPEALDEMTKGSGDEQSPVAPVDLSQAIIGPGMAVFSKYAAVLEADGTPMSVRTALQLINRFLAEDDFDHDTQFCLHWFDQYGWKEGRFGEADVLARAKATSVGGLAEGGVLRSGGGVVRLLRPDEYPASWNPQTDARRSVWETLHHLIRAQRRDGDSGAGRVLAHVKGQAEATRQLAYRLYTLCERRGWAEDARAYNELITGWSGIESAAGAASSETQSHMFDS